MNDDRRNDVRRRVELLCAQRRVTIRRTGNAHHLIGPGVDLLVADLAIVRADDLIPIWACDP